MDEPKMPWSGIIKVTAGFGALVTWYCWNGVRQELYRRAEAARPRWTDANRWDRD